MIRELVRKKHKYNCEMCGQYISGPMYKYQNHSYVPGYVPRIFDEICRKCIYRECKLKKDHVIK